MISFPLLSTACFPPTSYLALIAKHSGALIDPYENYSKQSYRNRYEIYGPNGKQTLSLPIVKNSGLKTHLIDTKIEFVSDWQKVHLRSIEAAYANTPFFEYYYPEIHKLITSHIEFLVEFNQLVLSELINLLKIKSEIHFTMEYAISDPTFPDFRESFHPKAQKRKNALNWCQEPYYQIFQEKHGFIPDLSSLDILFHLGPEAENYLLHQCNF